MKRHLPEEATKPLPRRIHITGGPGSGKSTLARELASLLGAPHFELDGHGLALEPLFTRGDGSKDYEGLIAAREAELEALSQAEAWVSDGANFAPAGPVLLRAEAIILMDAPWRVASYRIVSRHVKATLARNNRFPGWRRLYRFWRWSAAFCADRNLPELNVWGTPKTRSLMAELLHGYEAKILRCGSKPDVQRLLASLR
jgi:hypothetical protein